MASITQHAVRAFGAARSVVNNPGIAQDNIIFAMLLFAFIVWITTRGELQTYLTFFAKGSGAGPITDPVTASSTTGNQGQGSTPGVLANVAGSINSYVNSSAIGGAITSATGVPPLTIQATPGGLFSKFLGMFGGVSK